VSVPDPAARTGPPGSRLTAVSQLLTLPNLGLNLFLALAFLLVAARGFPVWWTSVLVLLAFFGARNAGHAFNQFVDRRLDEKNPRTRERPLVTGALSPSSALMLVVANVALFFAAAWLLRPWLVLLALPALALVLGYSYTKRFTAWTTVILGAVQALIPAGVYLAVDGRIPLEGWVAVGAMVLFGTGFETVHSLGDLRADQEQGLHSLPLAVGRARAPWAVAALLGSALGLLLIYLGLTVGFATLPWLAWAAMGAVAVWEVHGLRQKDRPLLPLFRAHFVMGALFLLGVAMFYAYPLF
jgi:4-hydroxybenzoate polyprenyltransferase